MKIEGTNTPTNFTEQKAYERKIFRIPFKMKLVISKRLANSILLTHFMPLVPFYTPSKKQSL